MEAKEWKFEKIIPDEQDMEAASKARDVYFDNLPPGVEKTAANIDVFQAAFYRGLAWAESKYDSKSWEFMRKSSKIKSIVDGEDSISRYVQQLAP